MTPTVPQPFPVHVRTGWIDFSPAVQQYASERIRSALAHHAAQIRSVSVRISSADPRRPAQRRLHVQVTTDTDSVAVSPSGVDLFALVDQAAEILLETLGQRSSGGPYMNLRQKIA